MKSRSASKIKLTSYDELIGGAVSKDDIQEILDDMDTDEDDED